MEKQIKQVIITKDTGLVDVVLNNSFTHFEIKDGILTFWFGKFNEEEFIKTIYAPGYWKKIEVCYY